MWGPWGPRPAHVGSAMHLPPLPVPWGWLSLRAGSPAHPPGLSCLPSPQQGSCQPQKGQGGPSEPSLFISSISCQDHDHQHGSAGP